MAGASLLPAYYKEKMNIAFFLAPPAAMKLTPNIALQVLSKPFYQSAITFVLDTIHVWNFLPYNYWGSEATSLICKTFNGKICDWAISSLFDLDPSIDLTERYDVFVSNIPAGSSAFNLAHYAQ